MGVYFTDHPRMLLITCTAIVCIVYWKMNSSFLTRSLCTTIWLGYDATEQEQCSYVV